MSKENDQLRIDLQKYQHYIQNVSQTPYRKPSYTKPKRKRFEYYDASESQESNSYISKIRKRPRQTKKRKIIYEDDVDGVLNEPDSPTEEEEEEEEENDDIYGVKNKTKGKQSKQIEKPKKKKKKGITKSIKL